MQPQQSTGTVKFFNTQKGFGFIVQDNGGKDVFVHISAVQAAGMQTLKENQKIGFSIKTDPKTGRESATDLQAL